LRLAGATHRTGKLIALALITLIVGLLITAAVFGVMAFVSGGPLSVAALLQKMADVVETARTHFPAWIQAYLPASAADMESAASAWLREHAGELRRAGGTFGRTLAYVLGGMIIGALVTLSDSRADGTRGPLTQMVHERARLFAAAFRRVAFAQVRISALNTLFTGLYLIIVLPLFGVHLPLAKTMIAVTFIAGLMPLLGNLVSNTVIVIVSLSVSLYVAIASLVFLVVIHKLEYLLNAQIIGTMIRARAWELLLAMLFMEALFGVPGLIAAPICYAYLKDELAARGAI
jgi:predicted PurR-regulated permease PerM